MLGASPAAAQSVQQLWAHCRNKDSFDYQIAGCTALLQSGGLNDRDRLLAYTFRGQAYFTKGDNDHAIADLSEAIALDQTNAVVFYMRGISFLNKVSDFDRAAADCDAAIRLDPKYQDAYRCRGNAYFWIGRYDRAIADYSAVIRFDPNNLAAFNNRAFAYHAVGDYDHAIADFTQTLRLDPKNAAFQLADRGILYRAKGDYGRAMADFNEAIRLAPAKPTAAYYWPYLNRGVTYLYTGALPKAVADLRQAAALYHDPYGALWLDIASRRSNLPSALAEAWKGLDHALWPAPIVELYLGQKTPEAVITAADDPNTRKKRSQTCEASFFVGEFLVLRGDKEGGRQFLKAAADDCPPNDGAAWPAKAELAAIDATRSNRF